MDEREPLVDLMEKYYKTQKECKKLTEENKELEKFSSNKDINFQEQWMNFQIKTSKIISKSDY